MAILKKSRLRGKQEIDLRGPQGNAYFLMANASNLAKQLGLDGKAICEEMRAGDYENLLKVFIETFAYMKNPANKERVMAWIAKGLKLDKRNEIENAYEEAISTYDRKPYLNLEGISEQIRMITELGQNPGVAKLKVEDVADQEILRRIDRSGFIDQLYQN